jgi:biopolymer transport protein ExbB
VYLCWLFAAAIVMLAAYSRPAIAAAVEDKLDLSTLGMGDSREDPVKALLQDAGTGDHKRFTIRTDDEIANLKRDDIYTDGLKTYFKVTDVAARDGRFEIERIAGTNNPDRKLVRVQAADEKNPGPPQIAVRQTLLDLVNTGGWPVYLIAGLAAVMIMLSINCVVLYRKSRQCPRRFVREASEALANGDLDKFEEAALRERGLLPYVCRAMTERFETSTAEDIERRCEIAAAGRINSLRTPAKLINVISVAAPLLGLFGTIVGMVVVFEAVAMTTGAAKATALASGIRVKLFSTAAALLVAIPSVFAYFIFSAMLGGVISETERLTEQFMHQILVIKRKKLAAAKKAARGTAADSMAKTTDGEKAEVGV